MDKYINTSNGGIPYVNNDHRWSDESIRNFINTHLSDFAVTIGSNGNFYLSGVAITTGGSDYTVTSGYVYINGEILKVDGGTYPLLIGANEYRFIAVQSYDTTGAKTTRSGSSINTYSKRRAVPTAYAVGDAWTDDMLAFELNNDQERLQEKLAYNIGISKQYTNGNLTTILTRIGNVVHAKVTASTTTDIGSGVLNSAPIDTYYRPTVQALSSQLALFLDSGTEVYPSLFAPIVVSTAGSLIVGLTTTCYIRDTHAVYFSYNI